MKTLKIVLIAIVITSLSIISCTKEGKQGEQGTAGINGNSNVSSSTYIISGSDWTYTSPSYLIDLSNSSITQGIINSGAVLVYYSVNAISYEQLPTTLYFNSNYSTTINAESSVGNVRLGYTDSDLTQPSLPFVMTIKIVVMSSSAITSNPNIDYSNYYEVKGAFNLLEKQ